MNAATATVTNITGPLNPSELLIKAGYPGGWGIQGGIATTLRETASGEAHSYRFTAHQENYDLPALTAAVARTRTLKPLKPRPGGEGRARIYLFTDPQIGKVDARRGVEAGTPEFIARMGRIRTEITQDLRDRPVERAVVADGGDGIESVQNAPG